MKRLFNTISSYALSLALVSLSLIPGIASSATIYSASLSFTNSTGGSVRIENIRWYGSYTPQFSTLTPAPGSTVNAGLRTVGEYGNSYFAFDVIRTNGAPADRCTFYLSIRNSNGSISSAYGGILGSNEGGSSCNTTQGSRSARFTMNSPPPPPPVDFYFDSGTLTPAITTTEGTVNIDYSVTSPGAAPTLPSVGFFLADEAYQALLYFGAIPVSSATGSDHAVQLSFAGLGLTPGNYNVILFADVNEEVAEVNEENNLGAFAITLTEEPAATADGEIISQWLYETAPSSQLVPADTIVGASKLELQEQAVETTGLLLELEVE